MSTGNNSISSTVANIALPPQSAPPAASNQSTSSAISDPSAQASAASSAAAQYSEYYSSPEYQQYYQQYYANAYSQQQQQQQYAAYYQATAAGASATNPAYTAAMYGQTQASYLSGAYQQALAVSANASTGGGEDDEDDDDDDPTIAKSQNGKGSNTLTYHCNAKMGLNPLIYTNIQQSPYFKNNLFQLKTYHEVIDEIYYNVNHLEPWEKGSRKVSGQTGMCGSVRGVGAGGIISTPFCILFKLYTLKLTRKQVNGLIRHKDSPFIRGLGFLFIRFTMAPQDLWQWFEPFLYDEEEVDPKAGGGGPMTIGEMVRHLLTKLDWFSTLFPRIPIPIQKEIEEKLRQFDNESYPEESEPIQSNKDRGSSSDAKNANNNKYSRSDAKYSKSDNTSRYNRRSRSRSPSRSSYQDKRSRKYDDDRGRGADDRSGRHHSRYHH